MEREPLESETGEGFESSPPNGIFRKLLLRNEGDILVAVFMNGHAGSTSNT